MLSVSERLSKILFRKAACATFQELKRFVSLLPKSISALASCTTSVYVNLSKNSFFHTKHPNFGRKRVQRYNKYQYHPNFKAKKFPKAQKFSGIITN